jgi:predicted RNA-binding Zn-ribbon protein involved in translation (DUF1610 family)
VRLNRVQRLVGLITVGTVLLMCAFPPYGEFRWSGGREVFVIWRGYAPLTVSPAAWSRPSGHVRVLVCVLAGQVALAVMLGGWLLVMFRSRVDGGSCQRCGYDLRGTLAAGRTSCPECGEVFGRRDPQAGSGRARRKAM